MRVGFVHGVMNTDNMSILGLTIDYGPYGWVDNFDPSWTPNTTDASGRRYCFGRQPEIARWSLERLADALSALSLAGVCSEAEIATHLTDGLAAFDSVYNSATTRMLANKFGWNAWCDGDADLVNDIFTIMQLAEIDMTDFFRQLALIEKNKDAISQSKLFDQTFYRDDLREQHHIDFNDWLARYIARLRVDNLSDSGRCTAMNSVNPRFVLRNYLAQLAIDKATAGDVSMIDELLDVLRTPYDDQPQRPNRALYLGKRPDWARQKAGCSMLSCSS